MAFKLKPLKEIYAMSKEKIDEAMAPIKAKQAKSKANVEMVNLEAEILNLETEITELCTKKEINFSELLDKLDELALKERRLEQYNEVVDQLFPNKS